MAIGAEQGMRGGRVREIMSVSVLVVAPGDAVRLAIQMMLWGGFRHLPVLDRGRLVGVVSDSDLFEAQARGRASGATPVREVMTARLETAAPDELVSDVAWRMAIAHIQSLPVIERGALVGIVTSTDLLAHMGRREHAPPAPEFEVSVGEVMARSPIVVHEDDSLRVPLGIMFEKGIRHLPVVDSAGRLIGMLSDRDLRAAVGDPLEALQTGGPALAVRTVGEIMANAPTRVLATAPLDDVARALLDERIGAVPVVDDDDRVVGIVSYIDLLYRALGRPPAASAPAS